MTCVHSCSKNQKTGPGHEQDFEQTRVSSATRTQGGKGQTYSGNRPYARQIRHTMAQIPTTSTISPLKCSPLQRSVGRLQGGIVQQWRRKAKGKLQKGACLLLDFRRVKGDRLVALPAQRALLNKGIYLNTQKERRVAPTSSPRRLRSGRLSPSHPRSPTRPRCGWRSSAA